MLLKCWLAGSFFKELSTLQSFLSTLNWRGKYHVLSWIHRDLTDEGSPKEWFIFSALSDRTRFHISEIFYSGTLWQLPCCYIVTSQSPLLTFSPACPECSRTALPAAGKQSQHLTALGCAPLRRLSWGHIIGLVVFQHTNNPVTTLKKDPSIPFSRIVTFTSS